MPAEELSEPTVSGPRGNSTEVEPVAESGPDSDEESVEKKNKEPASNNQGKRYPLIKRSPPRRFPVEEHVLLTDMGKPESIEEAKKDTHNRKWLGSM